MRTRDTQRARVYRADNALNSSAPKLETVRDVERFVRKTWQSKRVRAAFPKSTRWEAPRVKDGRGTRCAVAYGVYAIGIPLWARNAGVVCHELAHIIVAREYEKPGSPKQLAAHGWEFCETYLKLALYMIGREAHDALKAAFKKEKVRYRPKRRPPDGRERRPLTEEQRAALIARLAAGRAALKQAA